MGDRNFPSGSSARTPQRGSLLQTSTSDTLVMESWDLWKTVCGLHVSVHWKVQKTSALRWREGARLWGEEGARSVHSRGSGRKSHV